MSDFIAALEYSAAIHSSQNYEAKSWGEMFGDVDEHICFWVCQISCMHEPNMVLFCMTDLHVQQQCECELPTGMVVILFWFRSNMHFRMISMQTPRRRNMPFFILHCHM